MLSLEEIKAELDACDAHDDLVSDRRWRIAESIYLHNKAGVSMRALENLVGKKKSLVSYYCTVWISYGMVYQATGTLSFTTCYRQVQFKDAEQKLAKKEAAAERAALAAAAAAKAAAPAPAPAVRPAPVVAPSSASVGGPAEFKAAKAEVTALLSPVTDAMAGVSSAIAVPCIMGTFEEYTIDARKLADDMGSTFAIYTSDLQQLDPRFTSVGELDEALALAEALVEELRSPLARVEAMVDEIKALRGLVAVLEG